MSTASSRSIEAVAKANGDGHRWYQLYWYVFVFAGGRGVLTMFM